MSQQARDVIEDQERKTKNTTTPGITRAPGMLRSGIFAGKLNTDVRAPSILNRNGSLRAKTSEVNFSFYFILHEINIVINNSRKVLYVQQQTYLFFFSLLLILIFLLYAFVLTIRTIRNPSERRTIEDLKTIVRMLNYTYILINV